MKREITFDLSLYFAAHDVLKALMDRGYEPVTLKMRHESLESAYEVLVKARQGVYLGLRHVEDRLDSVVIVNVGSTSYEWTDDRPLEHLLESYGLDRLVDWAIDSPDIQEDRDISLVEGLINRVNDSIQTQLRSEGLSRASEQVNDISKYMKFVKDLVYNDSLADYLWLLHDAYKQLLIKPGVLATLTYINRHRVVRKLLENAINHMNIYNRVEDSLRVHTRNVTQDLLEDDETGV